MIVGGAQENTLLTIKGHLKKGHQVTLVTGPDEGREGKLLQFTGIPDFPVVMMPELCRELAPWRDLCAFVKLVRLFRRNRYDVVHTHSSKAGIIGRLAARFCGIPVIVHTVHGQAFTPYEKAWRNFIYILSEKIAAKCCHKIYAVARAMIDQCVKAKIAPEKKYMVVYSGMDTDSFDRAEADPVLRESLQIPPGVKVIATLARLFPQKGYEFIPDAFALAVRKMPDLHLLIIGDGIMRESIAAKFAELGVADKVSFAGLVAPAQIPSYLALSDMLWHLSLREGLPRAAVQALASGKPVIGFRLDGTPEVVIDNVTGFCFEPGDNAGVADAAVKILSDPGLCRQMGANGKKLVLENFHWQKMADILEKEYLQLFELAKR